MHDYRIYTCFVKFNPFRKMELNVIPFSQPQFLQIISIIKIYDLVL